MMNSSHEASAANFEGIYAVSENLKDKESYKASIKALQTEMKIQTELDEEARRNDHRAKKPALSGSSKTTSFKLVPFRRFSLNFLVHFLKPTGALRLIVNMASQVPI